MYTSKVYSESGCCYVSIETLKTITSVSSLLKTIVNRAYLDTTCSKWNDCKKN